MARYPVGVMLEFEGSSVVQMEGELNKNWGRIVIHEPFARPAFGFGEAFPCFLRVQGFAVPRPVEESAAACPPENGSSDDRSKPP